MKWRLDSISNQIDQAQVETLRLLYFRLGYCGRDEEVKALTSVTIGAAESFWVLFSEKSALSWPLKRPESFKGKRLQFLLPIKQLYLP